MRGKIAVLVTMLTLCAAAAAAAMGQGSSVFSIQLGQGKADLMNAIPPGSTAHFTGVDTGDPDTQIEVRGEYWYFYREDYAVNLSGGYGFFTNTDQAGNSPPAGLADRKFSTTSFSVRLGGDRVGKVGDRFTLFAGPGLEFWSGHAKYENIYGTTAPDNDVKGPTVTRFSFSGRLGGFMMLSDKVCLAGHIGHKFGYASAEDQGAKSTWWPSSFDGTGGIAFMFGGK